MKTIITNIVMHYESLQRLLASVLAIINAILSGDQSTSNYIALASALHFTEHSSGDKMEGFWSLSTSCIINPFCLARMKQKDSICSKCFSAGLQAMRKGLADHLIINTYILLNVLIPVDVFKTVFTSFFCSPLHTIRVFRLESFGDVGNITQALNYINLCKAFPYVTFTVWSKNKNIWEQAFTQEEKPKNLIYVFSSSKMNIEEEKPKSADKVFTVYDLEHALQEKKINCIQKCSQCMKCYQEETRNINIKEILKRDSKKYWSEIEKA